MPTIPMPGIPSVQRAPIGAAPQSMEAAVSPYLSNIRTAQVAANAVGGAISAYYEKSKKIKDSGDYAKAKLEMEKADADIEQWEAENPKEFDKYENNAKERINKARAAITQDMSGEVRQQVEQEFAVREQRTVTGAKYRATQKRNRDADTSLDALARLEFNRGNLAGGDAALAQRVSNGSITKEEADLVSANYRANGAAMATDERLVQIDDIASPRAKRDALSALVGELADVENNPDLSRSDRIKATSQAVSERQRVEREMERSALSLLNGVKAGTANLGDLIAANERGEIPEWVLGSSELAQVTAAAEQKAKEEAQQEAKTKGIAGEKLEKGLLQDFSDGEGSVQLAVERGEITQAKAGKLRSRLEVLSLAQRTRPEEEGVDTFGKLSDELDQMYAVTALGYQEESQSEEGAYAQLINRIAAAPLTETNRMALVGRVLEAKLADIQEGEEDQAGFWNSDRRISEPEKRMRTDLIKTYRELLPVVGLQQTGALLVSQEATIKEFFDSRNTPPVTSEVEKLKQTLTNQARSVASDELIRAAFDFQ
jgi:hypothetical protein